MTGPRPTEMRSMRVHRNLIAFTIAAAAVLTGRALAGSPAPPQPTSFVVYCYDSERDVVSRVLASQCRGQIIDATEAKQIEERRNQRVARALNMQQSGAASADRIFLPQGMPERDRTIAVAYRLYKPISGAGTLHIEWSDSAGRLVERRDMSFTLDHASEVTFSLDLGRVVATDNELRTHISYDEIGEDGATTHRENDQEIRFAVRPVESGWQDFQVIMWHDETPAQFAALKAIGISAARLAENETDALLHDDLRWYIENIATDFYAAYHRWFADRPVNWRFEEVKKLYKKNPLDVAAFRRDPSLSDAKWLAVIRERLMKTVRTQAPFRPLFYNLGDETGIGDLSIPWDFDFSEDSLKGLREWLKQRYGSLDALNREWGSNFTNWDSVTPMTTDQAMARSDDNFSAWADFKDWMDESFARALRAGTDAVHAADPEALAAIEGTQIPGWGGYDYARLANAVDVMEMYDAGGNLEIVRSLNPKLIILNTSFGSGPQEIHRFWRELLRGNRGLILWDEKDEFIDAGGRLGPRGKEAAAYFHEIRGGLGALLVNSERQWDPVAILYSPASMRTQWMLDWKPKGNAWATRDIKNSYEDANEVRSSMEGFANLLEHMGIHPRFLTDDLIDRGALSGDGIRILVLPKAIALAPDEADAIRRFIESGGLVIADSEPGAFDGHGRKLSMPLLSDVFKSGTTGTGANRVGVGEGVYLHATVEACATDPATVECQEANHLATAVLQEHGVSSPWAVSDETGKLANDVETYRYRNGGVTILALQRDFPASEDSRPGDAASSHPTVLTLPQAFFLYDVRRGKALGSKSRLEIALDPIQPSILAASATSLPAPTIAGPRALHTGETGAFSIGFAGASPASDPVLHVDVIDPSAKVVEHYSGNLIAHGGATSFKVPFAINDPAGTWHVRIIDILSGQSVSSELELSGP